MKPEKATAHYSSRGHLKFLKIDADSPGLPGKSSRQRLGEERRYTGTWADEIQGKVLENESISLSGDHPLLRNLGDHYVISNRVSFSRNISVGYSSSCSAMFIHKNLLSLLKKRFFEPTKKYPIFLNGDVPVSTEWAIESN